MTSARSKLTTWVPLALCIVLTAAASAFVGRAEHRAQQARFTNEMDSVRTHIVERMATYLGVLRGAVGMASHASVVTPTEFRAFVDHLNLPVNYPGTLGIGYSLRFGSMSAAAATARANAEGWSVRVWPDTPRDEVHAIVLLEPLDARNQAALGYDMRTEPIRREAMDRARDRGDVALSGKVTLVQEIEKEKQAGFLLYAPVYVNGVVPATREERRANLKGYVYLPLRAGDLFAGIFGDALPGVDYELYDGNVIDADRRLYTYGSRIGPHDRDARMTLPIAGRTWTLRFVPAPGTATGFLLTLEVAGLGLLLSAVVFFVTLARERARDREVRATAAALASEETARLREMFVGILGHDLRNPINSIVLNLEQLSRKLASDTSSVRLVERLRSSTHRMTRMIDQMLDLTRARLGGGFAINAMTADLGATARDVVDEIMAATPGCQVAIETRGELVGEWDTDRLAQALSNLLGNAVRYHREQPVRVTLDGTAPDRVRIDVHNAAVIPAALLPVIFDPFRRGDTRREERAPGLGLGLYITQQIVLAHQGSIEVVSNEAQGTTFTLVLPRRTAPSAVPLLASSRLAPA
jgi:signal transduction histidine kinase